MPERTIGGSVSFVAVLQGKVIGFEERRNEVLNCLSRYDRSAFACILHKLGSDVPNEAFPEDF
jgi:hypothetical protein